MAEAASFGRFLLERWQQVREGLLTTIDKFTDDELAFRPAAGVYGAAETMLHIGHEELIEVGYALLRRPAELPPAYDAALYRDRASIAAHLADVHAASLADASGLSDAQLMAPVELPWGQTATPAAMLFHVIEHEVHHRGELSLLLGLLGKQGLDA